VASQGPEMDRKKAGDVPKGTALVGKRNGGTRGGGGGGNNLIKHRKNKVKVRNGQTSGASEMANKKTHEYQEKNGQKRHGLDASRGSNQRRYTRHPGR